jgi:hypothetical protein
MPDTSRIICALNARETPTLRRLGQALVCLVLATAIWLPCVHFIFAAKPSDYLSAGRISPKAKALAAYQMRLWTDPALREVEIRKMRASNAEWDFMGRTFLVLALGNMAMREPADKAQYLEVMDHIIGETLKLEEERGTQFFLMGYANEGTFVQKPPRSLFVDGEIALMLGVRRLVEEREDFRPLLTERVRVIVERMRGGWVLCAESYPDECWMFCNTAALAAVRIADVLDDTDHSDFINDWLAKAKAKLVEPGTGMLISSFHMNGSVKDGPEGSSIWMSAHCLQVVDKSFAQDQYDRAKKELARSVLGFGYAREWPVSCVGSVDIDSGPIVPVLNASAGSSGLALMGAAAFGDIDFFRTLCASLNLGGFPVQRNGALKYSASNQVGDAVMLHSMTLGPLWQKVSRQP